MYDARRVRRRQRHGRGSVKRSLLIVVGGLTLLASGGSSPPQAVTVIDTAHTSQNALDWAGAYRGVIPCADCQGIETVVILKSDGTFTRHFKYLGKGDEVFSKEGRFTWNAAGSIVTLAGDAQYLVGENHLTRLALDGSRVTGALADRYVLAKVPEGGVAERYWKLVELNGQPLPKLECTGPRLMLDREVKAPRGGARARSVADGCATSPDRPCCDRCGRARFQRPCADGFLQYARRARFCGA
jgi:copper homeostasis protein (lipoprotein)